LAKNDFLASLEEKKSFFIYHRVFFKLFSTFFFTSDFLRHPYRFPLIAQFKSGSDLNRVFIFKKNTKQEMFHFSLKFIIGFAHYGRMRNNQRVDVESY